SSPMSRPPAAWEEEECLEYYGMASLHRLFEVVGAQLTPSDVAVLSFLLDEAHPPARPRNGVELLLELERRGLCDEGNFRHLLELLRVLTRHDLLHCVTLRRPRTVSPERFTCGPAVVGSCLNAAAAQPRQEQWETGRCRGSRRGAPWVVGGAAQRRPKIPGFGFHPLRHQVFGAFLPGRFLGRLPERVPAGGPQGGVFDGGAAAGRPRGPGRQLDVFSQANGVLKSRDLGSILCDIKFSELSYLDAFWGDYLNGSLLEALKGVFLTEGLRRAVGRE
ncbi:DNA-binding death effector domain-containing protein 2, partial [Spheniscus magellanicus]